MPFNGNNGQKFKQPKKAGLIPAVNMSAIPVMGCCLRQQQPLKLQKFPPGRNFCLQEGGYSSCGSRTDTIKKETNPALQYLSLNSKKFWQHQYAFKKS